jgi:[ribosomal protein S18]-alanine N-acetyltransferase
VIRLRDGVEADADRLFELDRICFPAGIAYSLREFHWLLRSRKTLCLVAEDEGVLAGFVMAQESVIRKSRGAHIVTIDVAPDSRRRGVGRLLMERVEERLRTASANWMRLEVAVDNSAAYEFYRGLGFSESGRIPNYYQGKVGALVMEKTLAKRDTLIR